VGIILVGRPPVGAVHTTRHETRTLVSVLLAATAAGPVLAAFSSTAVGPLSVLQYLFTSPSVAPSTVASVCADHTRAEACVDLVEQLRSGGVGPSVLSVLPAVLVLVIAVGLRRGRRFAWLGAVALHALLAGFGLLVAIVALRMPGENMAGLALNGTRGALGVLGPLVQPALVLLVLLATRRAFDISAPPGTYLRVGKAIGSFVCYVGLGSALASQFDPAPTVVGLALDFPLRLVPAGYLGLVEPAFFPTTAGTTVLFEWTGVVLWSAAIGWVLRSYRRCTTDESDADTQFARQVLMRHGDTPLSYLTMWRGNSYWFTPSGQSYVAYRVRGGVAITTADPIGPTNERETAVRGFIEFCRTHGWIPCWYSVTEQVRQTTAALGWASVQVAEETVLPLGSLAFTGRRFQDVRTALNRAEKVGITAEWVSYPETPHTFTDQIETIAEEWVSDKGMPEMGFTLGGLDELDDPAVRCLLAIDADRTVHGITSWLPVHRDGKPIGWTLDFMRRRSSGFNGVMEFLIGSAALRFQAEGAEFVSLSGAPLARTDDPAAASGLQRLLDVMGRTLEPVYGFRSLLAFKAKFQPQYQALYMCYPEAATLPRIGNAITRAYLPQLTLRQGLRIMSRL
jgi:phosphatidylglycerol lysyltransferase